MNQQLLTEFETYLDGRSTLEDLESWLLSNLQGILDSGDERAIQAADQTDADFVELGEGLMDHTVFREHLEDYVSSLRTVPFTFPEGFILDALQASTSAETLITRTEVTGSTVDLRLVLEFA